MSCRSLCSGTPPNVDRQEMAIPLARNEVTLEEIDVALAALASRCRFSSPAVRQSTAHDCHEDPDGLLRPLFHRLRSRDAKWLTRMLLKSYSPVIIPEHLVLTQYHFLLPELLKFQSNFDAAIALLRGPVITKFPTHPEEGVERERVRQAILQQLKPKVGVKVGRTAFFKARSVRHCLEMVGQQRMSLERKYDGEYCQIHIDLAKKENWLQIFSKSGKDSTADRQGIHQTIRECLRIDQTGRAFSEKCILEGELVVYSDKDERILEFHKLRKHVSRSGSFLGIEKDSQPHEHEHLMIIFYDILLLDDKAVLTRNYNERKGALDSAVLEIPGRARLAWRKQISFKSPNAAASLRKTFARGIGLRWEGFVLKPVDQPYFGLGLSQTGYWIKLKKDYIKGLGDTADFAVVGAGFSAGNARVKDKGLPWTHFHIGCLQNKEEVLRFGVKPRWRIIQPVNECINKEDLKTLNHVGQFYSVNFGGQTTFQEFDVIMDLSQEDCKMDVVFRQPFVFDIMGGGFVKPPGKRFYTLRWPRVEKIHWDRSWTDTISFEELQKMATEAVTAPEGGASQEEIAWIERLETADMGQRRADAMRADSSWQAARAPEGEDGDSMDNTQSTSSSSKPLIPVNTIGARLSGPPVEAERPGSLTSVLRSEARPLLPTPPSSDPSLEPSKVASITKAYNSTETVVQEVHKGRDDDEVPKSTDWVHDTSNKQRAIQPKREKASTTRVAISNEAAIVQECKNSNNVVRSSEAMRSSKLATPKASGPAEIAVVRPGKESTPRDSSKHPSGERTDASFQASSIDLRQPLWAGEEAASRLSSLGKLPAFPLRRPLDEMAKSGEIVQDTTSKKRKAADAGDASLPAKKRKGPITKLPSPNESATVQMRKEDKVARSAKMVQNASSKKRKAVETGDASLKTKKAKAVSNAQQVQSPIHRMDQSAQASTWMAPEFSKPLADIINSSDIRPRPPYGTGSKSISSGDSPSRSDLAFVKEHEKEIALHMATHQPATAPTYDTPSNQETRRVGAKMPSSSFDGSPRTHSSNDVLTSLCTVKGASCKLADTIALLSPCVAQMPYLTEDMLRRHGISFTADVNDLENDNNRDKRKIVLVETHRAGPTAETIHRLTTLDLPRWDVEVYDWRLLECLAKEERDDEGDLGFDYWERCFVCTV